MGESCVFCKHDAVTAIDVTDHDNCTHTIGVCLVCVSALEERAGATIHTGDDG
jgi:hypothetical protein